MAIYSFLPKLPGVYLFKNEKGDILYIGKAKNLIDRVKSYFLNKDLPPRTGALVSQIRKIDYVEVASERDLVPGEVGTVIGNLIRPRMFLAVRVGGTRLIDNAVLYS